METNRERKLALLLEFLKPVPVDIEKLIGEGVTFARPSFDEYGYSRFNEYMEIARKSENEAKAYYKRVKGALDRFAAKNPDALAKDGAVKEVASICTASANNEYFGYVYNVSLGEDVFSFTLIRQSNRVFISGPYA